MEHLPNYIGFKHPLVPYLYDESFPYIYDNLPDIFHFPTRMGWNMDDFLPGKYDEKGPSTPGKAASLIQAWLYFGLVHMITGVNIDTQDFLHTTSLKREVVTTTKLPCILEQWRRSTAGKSGKEREDHGTFLDLRFSALEPYLSLLCANDCLLHEIRHSMNILQSTLQQMKLAMFPDSTRIRYAWLGDFDKVIKTWLYENGWCRSQVSRLFQQLSPLTLYYASTSGPYSQDRDHSRCKEHSQCTARNVQIKENEPTHVRPDCDCEHFEVAQEQLIGIIAHGGIPLVEFSNDGRPRVVPYDMSRDRQLFNYVAISHLWSDGLGIPSRNIMSMCQMHRMNHRVQAVAAKYQDPNG